MGRVLLAGLLLLAVARMLQESAVAAKSVTR